jgi:hypothetical protein
MFNVDEIDTRGQFHQCSMSSFYAHRSQKCKKGNQVVNLFVLARSSQAKAAHRMSMKLTLAAVKVMRVEFVIKGNMLVH